MRWETDDEYAEREVKEDSAGQSEAVETVESESEET